MKRCIVLDTNCLLPILGAHTPYNYLWDKFIDEEFVLCVSTDILEEYEEILRQKASPVAADMFLKTILHAENVVRKDPYFRLGLITVDPDDNKFVDCAFACQAEYIVTEDTHFEELSRIDFPRIEVKTLDEFCKDFPSNS